MHNNNYYFLNNGVYTCIICWSFSGRYEIAQVSRGCVSRPQKLPDKNACKEFTFRNATMLACLQICEADECNNATAFHCPFP